MVDHNRASIGTLSGSAGKASGWAGIQVGIEAGILVRGVKYP